MKSTFEIYTTNNTIRPDSRSELLTYSCTPIILYIVLGEIQDSQLHRVCSHIL
jgi:hypothetical protein